MQVRIILSSRSRFTSDTSQFRSQTHLDRKKNERLASVAKKGYSLSVRK
jgi:hypothetical protein